MTDGNSSDWLVIRKESAVAFGKPVQDGFLVRAGSTAMRNGSPQVKRDRGERDRLVAMGVLVQDENPSMFRFAVDHVFSSRSMAAGVVIDGNSNGSHWKSGSVAATLGDVEPTILAREMVEAAMDAYDQYRLTGAHSEIFDHFGEPRDYWVRSTRERPDRVYPTKPIVGFARGKTELNAGWGQKEDAAARLHNSGFIIVDKDNNPVPPPDRYEHLIRDADRIRLCALNYYIEPARERGENRVTVRAGTLHSEMGLDNAWANVCQALAGQKFQDLAKVPPPTKDGPDQSTSTAFTFSLRQNWGSLHMKAETTVKQSAATNLIFYGPPGTGKTYATAWEAVRLCIGEEAAASLGEDRNALMAEYRRLASEGRIEFVTFHQSMSYEDFVEGRQPMTGLDEESTSGGFRLETVPGIFRRIAKRAEISRGPSSGSNAITIAGRKVFKMSIGRVNFEEDAQFFEEATEGGYALLGWENIDWSDERYAETSEILETCRKEGKIPGPVTAQSGQVQHTDLFRNQLKIGDIIVVSKGNGLFRAIGEVTGEYEYHPRPEGIYTHRRPVQWLWVDSDGVPSKEIYQNNFTQPTIYRLRKDGLNIPALERYMNSGRSEKLAEPESFVLIIDEINRANISKVFGELITLLESDKRLGQPNALKVRLPYSGDDFGVPSNLHIIATMNTADRSIALLDTALRRRFMFRELMPDPSLLPENLDGINLRKLLTTINERIEYLFDREHQIGHAYFVGCSSRNDLEDVMRHKIIPLLSEYFYEDWSKVAAVLGDGNGTNKPGFLEFKRLLPPTAIAEDEMGSEKLRWIVKKDFDFSGFGA